MKLTLLVFNAKQGLFNPLLRLLTFLSLLQVAFAFPTDISKTTDVTTLAFDKDIGDVFTYKREGTLFERFPKDNAERQVVNLMERDGSTCTPLSADDVQKLPGWAKIDQYFRSTYGQGKARIVTNPPEWPGTGATLCVDTNAIPVALQGQPNCNSGQSQIDGEVDGTTGKVQVAVTQGYSNDGNWHVDQTATLGVDTEFHIELGIPEIADVGGSVKVSTSLANTISRGFTTSVNTGSTQQLTIDNPDGKKCHAEITTKTCTVGGSAQIPVVASGWVWYYFEDKTSPAGQNDPHLEWRHLIEDLLTEAERSSKITVVGNMNAVSKSGYQAVCT